MTSNGSAIPTIPPVPWMAMPPTPMVAGSGVNGIGTVLVLVLVAEYLL